jgi:MauM/NapG family ferredoxin protein
MRFQRIIQTVSLSIFIALLLLAVHPQHEGLAVDFFLRLDPLVCLGTMLATRHFDGFLIPGLAVLLSVLLAGRLFCGHICPMGTTLDVLRACLQPKPKMDVPKASYETTQGSRLWKYLFLLVIAGAALGGVSLVFLGSPLSWVTRLYGLALQPVGLLGLDALLDLAGQMVQQGSASEFAAIDLPQRAFQTNVLVAGFFVALTALAYYCPRFWCRHLCPAGALLALFSRNPVLKRHVSDKCINCGKCVKACPTGAIGEAPEVTAYAECIVCLRCTEVCPVKAVSFTSTSRNAAPLPGGPNPERRGMILALGSGLFTAGLWRTGIHSALVSGKEKPLVDGELIRPPGSIPEGEFLSRCIRCGECMKACPTNTLQPIWFRAGPDGIFSPVMTPRLAACATGCNLCGNVCPTGAIRALPLLEKAHAKVGTAWIARHNCLVWEQDRKCLVCDEVCPYNAVSFRAVEGKKNAVPFVTANRCTGCGWCENKCPVEGTAAIRVNIIGEVRLSSGSYVEKAKEYGFEFRTKDNSQDSLAEDTFEGAIKSPNEKKKPVPSPSAQPELPEGFTDK